MERTDLGSHTDYNEGLVLSLAIDRCIFMAVAPRPDDQVELASSNLLGRETFNTQQLVKNEKVPWSNYVKGVLHQLQRSGVHFGGFRGAIHGTIPVGAGLSSSAALEVAAALAVKRLYPYSLTTPNPGAPLNRNEKMALAKLCLTAEREFVGVNCGILDQLSSLFGEPHHAMCIDCQSVSVEHEPINDTVAVIVCNSGVQHALVEGGYNALRHLCENAARKLGEPSLRGVSIQRLRAGRASLEPREWECALHVVTEIARVAAGRKLLHQGNHKAFGKLMFESHESSRNTFKNSCAELDLLVDLAREQPGCLGARLTGGGFGGATINLVEAGQADQFQEEIARLYEHQTGIALDPIRCQIVEGAGAPEETSSLFSSRPLPPDVTSQK